MSYEGLGFFSGLALTLTLIAGWVTHVIVCIQTASWVLLIAGAIAFPIGIVHGIGIWFGAF
jgi:hypothetical protein